VHALFERTMSLDAPTAASLAAAMRDVALADGTHPAEEQLIAAFEADVVTPGVAPLASLDAVTDLAVQEVFLQSLVLVALADGHISDEERQVIGRYATSFGLSDLEVARCVSDVGGAMLAQLAGVKLFREDAVAVGHAMGLDAFTIRKALEA